MSSSRQGRSTPAATGGSPTKNPEGPLFWHPGCHQSHVAVDPEGERRKDRKFVERLGIAHAEQRPHLGVRFIQDAGLLRFQGSRKHDDGAARI